MAQESWLFHDISNLLPSYLKVKDRNDEDDDSEEDDDEEDNEEEEDDDDEGQEDKNLVYKSPIRHPRQRTGRVTGGYNRPPPPQHNSVALQILIDGHQNSLPNAEINKNLINTYNKAVDEGENLQEIFCRPNSDGVTALTAAVLSGNCGVAVCILQIMFQVFPNYREALQYINQVDCGGNNMVHEMAYMGQKTIQTMEKLLKLRICDVSKDLQLQSPIFNSNVFNNLGQHPVHFCFKSPTFCREAILVFHNINQNTLASEDCKQNNILHYFMQNLPHFCNNFETCDAAAVAVKETLEFLIGFYVVKACLWARNNQNRTPEDDFRQIQQLEQQAWTAAHDFLQVQKKPKPVLLQIPMSPIVLTLDEEEESSEKAIAVPDNSNLPSPGSNLPSPGANLPSPGSNLPFPGSNLTSPGSNLHFPGSNLPSPGSNLHFPGSNLPSPGSNLPSSGAEDSGIKTSDEVSGTLEDIDVPDIPDDVLNSILASCTLSFDQGSLVDNISSCLKE